MAWHHSCEEKSPDRNGNRDNVKKRRRIFHCRRWFAKSKRLLSAVGDTTALSPSTSGGTLAYVCMHSTCFQKQRVPNPQRHLMSSTHILVSPARTSSYTGHLASVDYQAHDLVGLANPMSQRHEPDVSALSGKPPCWPPPARKRDEQRRPSLQGVLSVQQSTMQ